MSHIFISHVEEDADIALEIALGLEEAGYTTWCYELDSIPGPSYLIQTGQAIEQSEAVVLVISPDSLGSHQVTREVVRSYEGGKQFIPVLRGITHVEFQNRQPEWREAVGAATSIQVTQQGVAGILPRVVDGLKALGIQPKPEPDATRISRIHSTLDELHTRGIPAPIPSAPAVGPPAEVSAPAVSIVTVEKKAPALLFWLGLVLLTWGLGAFTALLWSLGRESGGPTSIGAVFGFTIPFALMGILLIWLSGRRIRHSWFWPGAVMLAYGLATLPAWLDLWRNRGVVDPVEWGLITTLLSVPFVIIGALSLWRGWPRTRGKHPRGEVSGFVIAMCILSIGFALAIWATGAGGETDILSFSDDFEDGAADGWDLDPGWRVVLDDGNYVLRCQCDTLQKAWPDVTKALNYAVEADFKFLSGLTFFVRQYGVDLHHYTLWMRNHEITLAKGVDPAVELARADVDIGSDRWHSLEIALDGGNIKVYIDGELEIDYWDDEPLPEGSFFFQSNSDAWVDNILVRSYP